MDSPAGQAMRTVAAYLSFLHDRLVVRLPGITGLTICVTTIDGAPFPVVQAHRRDVDTHHYELAIAAEGALPESSRVLSVPFTQRGLPQGLVVFDVPADLAIGPEMHRRLQLYALATVSGLRLDLGPDWWAGIQGSLVVARDVRPGSHLERVAAYAHLIVRALAEPLHLTTSYADAVVRYAPLHDVGQVVFADHILQKPGRLDPEEWRLMQSHTTRGAQIVDDLLTQFGPGELPHAEVLRAVVLLHHEALDGTGYPGGVRGDDIPLEARIVTVADVFDALTSKRPYKPNWSADEALSEMDRMVAAGKIDGTCLTALVTQPDVIEFVASDNPVVEESP